MGPVLATFGIFTHHLCSRPVATIFSYPIPELGVKCDAPNLATSTPGTQNEFAPYYRTSLVHNILRALIGGSLRWNSSFCSTLFHMKSSSIQNSLLTLIFSFFYFPLYQRPITFVFNILESVDWLFDLMTSGWEQKVRALCLLAAT